MSTAFSGEQGPAKSIRTQLIETAQPVLEALVREVTGVEVLSLHHDISAATCEEIVLFTLTEPPLFRETKKKRGLRKRGKQRSRS